MIVVNQQESKNLLFFKVKRREWEKKSERENQSKYIVDFYSFEEEQKKTKNKK